ncbi:hypothetical protein GF389_02425 [Candidatus Dojkabacteria bacterium]|nr:hypothetical protein [Candidatus Dojkabacteria bacterium]
MRTTKSYMPPIPERTGLNQQRYQTLSYFDNAMKRSTPSAGHRERYESPYCDYADKKWLTKLERDKLEDTSAVFFLPISIGNGLEIPKGYSPDRVYPVLQNTSEDYGNFNSVTLVGDNLYIATPPVYGLVEDEFNGHHEYYDTTAILLEDPNQIPLYVNLVREFLAPNNFPAKAIEKLKTYLREL